MFVNTIKLKICARMKLKMSRKCLSPQSPAEAAGEAGSPLRELMSVAAHTFAGEHEWKESWKFHTFSVRRSPSLRSDNAQRSTVHTGRISLPPLQLNQNLSGLLRSSSRSPCSILLSLSLCRALVVALVAVNCQVQLWVVSL